VETYTAIKESELVEEVLSTNSVTTFFQPIISIRKRQLVGLEALSRAYWHGELIPPLPLFAAARNCGKISEIEKLCRAKSLANFAKLPSEIKDSTLLFLNVDDTLLDQNNHPEALMEQLAEHNIPSTTMALEILESETLHPRDLKKFVDIYRSKGFLIAMDDVGSGASNLARMIELLPDIVKIDRSLISGIFQDSVKQRVVQGLTQMAHQIGAQVITEGIEMVSEGATCQHYDTDMMQGYLFGVPSPDIEQDISSMKPEWNKILHTYRASSLKTLARKKQRFARYSLAVQTLSNSLNPRNLEVSLQNSYAEVKATFPEIVCTYLLNREGIQVTPTIGLPPTEPKNLFYIPAGENTDHSMKPYFMTIDAGAEQFFSDPYISLANGEVCRTLAILLPSYLDNAVLCADFHTPY